MNNLANQIKQYYENHFNELSGDKQFHFCTRIAAWETDEFCDAFLRDADYITHGGDKNLIRADLLELLNNPPEASINAAETRAPYFAKYPGLRGQILAMFRVRHLLYIYKIDVRDEFLSLISQDELWARSRELEGDTETLKILSTYAINFIYLANKLVLQNPNFNETEFLERILSLGEQYGDTAEQIQLQIYLYTHCIIGNANFYLGAVSSRDLFKKMLVEIEEKIAANFIAVNLDNKFEFLVCSKMINYTSELADQIYTEADQSISPDGTWLIDTLNNNRQGEKTTLDLSEHRNVLYIMSNLTYPRVQEIRN